MKKSILNTTITLALSTALLSGVSLSTNANADSYQQNVASSLSNDGYTDSGYVSYGSQDTDFYTEMFSNQVSNQVSNEVSLTSSNSESELAVSQQSLKVRQQSEHVTTDTTADITTQQNDLQVAQLGSRSPIVEHDIDSQRETLLDIMTADLSLDVYFRSGSTDIESFYPARLAAIANLLNTMDDLEIHLDGYTDRRGDKSQNIALANDRIEKVRQQLIDAGVDENRINSRAFGEMKMVSAPGDLEAYTFDRKVVIRFERSTLDSIHNMKAALSDTQSNEISETTNSPIAAVSAAVIAADTDTGAQVADAGTRF